MTPIRVQEGRRIGRTSICMEGDGSRNSSMIVFKCDDEVM